MKTTLVLLHGFGEDSNIWNGFVPFLQKDFQVICPDYSLNDDLTSIDDYADFVNAELDRVGVSLCIMVGHSMGGYITLAFAEKYPEKMLGLGLFHSTTFDDSAETKANRLKTADFLQNYGTEAFIKSFTPNLFATEFAKEHPEIIQKHIDAYAQLPVSALVTATLAMRNRPSRQHILQEANYPILLIIGGQDSRIPMADLVAQSKMPKKPSIEIFYEVGHMGMLEEPFETLQALRNFLRFCSNKGLF
jgi:pimeloyl-ACP methyl ester carboxylesterase